MPRKFPCVACGKPIFVSVAEPGEDVQCRKCGKRMPVPADADAGSAAEYQDYLRGNSSGAVIGGTAVAPGDFGMSAAGAVGGAAWLVLILHIVGAIAIWVTMGRVEVSGYYGSHIAINPVGVGIGAAVLLEGIVFCIVLRAIHWTARNVADLRIRTERHTG